MNIKFNKIRYIELLKKSRNLDGTYSYLSEEDDDELLSYGIRLENQIYYNRRHHYISLIEEYFMNEINSFCFKLQFFQMEREDRKIQEDLKKNFERLDTLLIDSELGEFSSLINHIYAACDALKSDSELEDNYGITELQLRAFLKKTFLQIQKYSDQ